jgi:hypothetical protein
LKAVGYALVLSALLGGAYFVIGLLNGLARDACARNCPNDPSGIRVVFDIGGFKYQECMCK